MKIKQHRATRHAFVARVEIIDLESEKELIARTGNLSIFGCFIQTPSPFPRSTRVRLRISYHGTTLVVVGQVADVRPGGMGIRFGAIEPPHQEILEDWLAQLRSNPE